ncbi:MAG: MATE family efflux transporter [Calditerrivibrio sp.]|nr:MATE family efflux transporter [Calditerrivibrio sp.]
MRRYFFVESKRILKIALPIIVASISHLLMGFTDNVMAGRYSSVDLAAVSIGSAIWLPITLFFMSVLSGATPIISAELGGNNLDEAKDVFKTSVYIAVIFGVMLFVIFNLMEHILAFFIVERDILIITSNYLYYISFGVPAFLLYQSLRSYFESKGYTVPIMFCSFVGMLLNIPVNYIFIYGKFGMKALGGAGCGVATTISTYVMVLLLFIIYKRFPYISGGKLTYHAAKRILKLGLPIGISTFLEAFVFSFGSVILAPLGPITVAAHQIALNFISTAFMIPMSLGIAISIRVSHEYGKGELYYSSMVWKIGALLVVSIAFVSSLAMYLTSDIIVKLYTKDVYVLMLAKPLMVLAICFHFVDAFQVAANNTLKGYHNTKYPMWICFISYWIIALPLGYFMTYKLSKGVIGFWYSLIIGIIIAAIMFGYKLISKYSFKKDVIKL